jgi:signal transduction histidine kinase
MKVFTLFAFSSLSFLTSVTPGITAGTGPLEARDMLEVAVLALKADPAKALEMFSRGNAAFRQGELYVFCADETGKVVAHGLPSLVGQDFASLKDKTGKAFGRYILDEARLGEVKLTGYYLPKPSGDHEVYKEDYFTKIGNLTCGVGYYSTKIE